MNLAIATRNEAYFAHRDSGKLGEQERKIMTLFHRIGNEGRDFTRREISVELGIEYQTVTARVTDLLASGYLEELPVTRLHRLPGAWTKKVTSLRLPAAQGALFA